MKLWGTLIAFFICLHQHYGHSAEIEENAAEQSDSPMVRTTRGGLGMLRLGRGANLRTRGVRMLRLGKRSDSIDPELLDILEDSFYLPYEQEKHPMERQPPLPRYGKRMSPEMAMLLQAEGYGSHMRPAPRLGRFRRSMDSENDLSSEISDEIKESKGMRAIPIPRFGRKLKGQDKNNVLLPRISPENEEDESLENDKRGLAMLRLGRSMKMLRLGKREPDVLDDSDDKRSLALLRLGKRRMRMLRLGKRDPEDGEEAEKKSLKLLRLGKREDSDHQIDTRALSMLRLGRSENADKRSLKLLRLG